METFSIVALFLQLFVLNHLHADVLSTFDFKATLEKTTFVGEGRIHSSGKACVQFRGIRYGRPPGGNKRFQKSTMFKYQEGTVDAKKYGNVCLQKRDGNSHITRSDIMDEDCLFLNIITPIGNRTTAPAVDTISQLGIKKAVYIFIHDGAFLKGSSNQFDPKELATRGDVTVVTINYRLGIFGFLTTDDDVMPANLGLWDQQLAIRWVKENIEAFGGDSSRITVGGQYAGSVSAILQSFYDGNKDLFQNTIAQSGSPIAYKTVSPKGSPITVEIAAIAGCNTASKKGKELSRAILNCLKRKRPIDLINLKYPRTRMGPVLDNDFITQKTFKLSPHGMRRFTIPESISQAFAQKNLIIGFSLQDGIIAVKNLVSPHCEEYFQMSKDEIVGNIRDPHVLRHFLEKFAEETDVYWLTKRILAYIMRKYLDWAARFVEKGGPWFKSTKLMTDMCFINPAISTALLHSKANTRGKTFMYASQKLPSTDNVEYTLPVVTTFTLSAWSNFIKTGDPNSENVEKWEEYTDQSKAYIDVSDKPTNAMKNPFESRKFWNEDLANLRWD